MQEGKVPIIAKHSATDNAKAFGALRCLTIPTLLRECIMGRQRERAARRSPDALATTRLGVFAETSTAAAYWQHCPVQRKTSAQASFMQGDLESCGCLRSPPRGKRAQPLESGIPVKISLCSPREQRSRLFVLASGVTSCCPWHCPDWHSTSLGVVRSNPHQLRALYRKQHPLPPNARLGQDQYRRGFQPYMSR